MCILHARCSCMVESLPVVLCDFLAFCCTASLLDRLRRRTLNHFDVHSQVFWSPRLYPNTRAVQVLVFSSKSKLFDFLTEVAACHAYMMKYGIVWQPL